LNLSGCMVILFVSLLSSLNVLFRILSI
jgi:hypothetical protein